MNYKNEDIWRRMEILPGFKVIKEDEKEGEKKKCPRYVNWPTIGASLSPLQAGRNASLREIEAYLDATEKGVKPPILLDHPELTKQVQREINRRRRENRVSGRSHSFARSGHGCLF